MSGSKRLSTEQLKPKDNSKVLRKEQWLTDRATENHALYREVSHSTAIRYVACIPCQLQKDLFMT